MVIEQWKKPSYCLGYVEDWYYTHLYGGSVSSHNKDIKQPSRFPALVARMVSCPPFWSTKNVANPWWPPCSVVLSRHCARDWCHSRWGLWDFTPRFCSKISAEIFQIGKWGTSCKDHFQGRNCFFLWREKCNTIISSLCCRVLSWIC